MRFQDFTSLYRKSRYIRKKTSSNISSLLSDLVNSTVRFDEKGDGQAPYIIYNYRRSNVTGEFHYERVGKWLAVDEGLHLNAEEIRFGSKETHDR